MHFGHFESVDRFEPPHTFRSLSKNFPFKNYLSEASRHLQSVVIENKDFEKLIAQYDRPNTIFYLDPPYYETEDYYKYISEHAKKLVQEGGKVFSHPFRK